MHACKRTRFVVWLPPKKNCAGTRVKSRTCVMRRTARGGSHGPTSLLGTAAATRVSSHTYATSARRHSHGRITLANTSRATQPRMGWSISVRGAFGVWAVCTEALKEGAFRYRPFSHCLVRCNFETRVGSLVNNFSWFWRFDKNRKRPPPPTTTTTTHTTTTV